MPDLVALSSLGNARCVYRQSLARSDPPVASLGHQPFSVFRSIRWNTLVGPRLRQWLREQQVLVFIGVLVCLVLWALRLQIPFVQIMVMSVCIGNVLNTVMKYSGRW